VQQGNVGLEAATSKELTEAGISGTLGKRDCPRTAPGKPIVSFGVKAHPCFFVVKRGLSMTLLVKKVRSINCAATLFA
jgi:hypothetical protein